MVFYLQDTNWGWGAAPPRLTARGLHPPPPPSPSSTPLVKQSLVLIDKKWTENTFSGRTAGSPLGAKCYGRTVFMLLFYAAERNARPPLASYFLHVFKQFCSEFKMAAIDLRYLLLLRKFVYIDLCCRCFPSKNKWFRLAIFQRTNFEPRKVAPLSTFRSSTFSAATISNIQSDSSKSFRFYIFRIVEIRLKQFISLVISLRSMKENWHRLPVKVVSFTFRGTM